MLLGIGLAGQRSRWGVLSDLTIAGVLTTGYMALMGYLYGLRPLYGYLMALPTAVLLIVAGNMLLFAVQRSWFRAVVLSPNAGGILLRRLGPLVIVGVPLLGWIRLEIQRRGWVPLEFGTAALVVATILLFSAPALMTAATLNRLDAQQKQAQAALVRAEKLAAVGRLASTVAHEVNNPLEATVNLLY
jgi:signal transduction histidine kinase